MNIDQLGKIVDQEIKEAESNLALGIISQEEYHSTVGDIDKWFAEQKEEIEAQWDDVYDILKRTIR